jgi:hypothetical protein
MRRWSRWLAVFAVLLVCANASAAGGGTSDADGQRSTAASPRGDTDRDGLSDAAEIRRYRTDPGERDTDADGLSDGAEIRVYHTNPRKPDTDRDGLSDGDEIRRYRTDPRQRDTDGDRLQDGEEIHRYRTNARRSDTDSDGLRDAEEVKRYRTNPRKADSDGDGLRDSDELRKYGTNPLTADSDGDGSRDLAELRGATNPLNARSHLGYPDATDTGVPAGTSLKPTVGFTAGTNNAVYDGLDIRGTVTVTATNVTIKNSKIRDVGFFGVDVEGGSVTLQNVEIDCGGPGSKGILNGGFTAFRVNIHNCEDGVFADQGFTIRDSYIHDLATSPVSHNDGIQSADAINVTIVHNTIYGTDTSAVNLNQNTGGPLAQNALVKDNLLAGGGWTLYCPAEASTNVQIADNAFSTKFFPKVGGFGPATDCGRVIQSGNVYHETGEPITLG